MMKKIMSIAIAALTTANLYAAETYNIEAGAQYYTLSNDANSKINMTAVGGTYYLKPIVMDGSQPFAEVDVLQKASGVSVHYMNMNTETAELASTTVTPIQLSGKFYVEDFVFSFSNFSYDKNFHTKANAANYYGIKATSNAFAVGYWVLPSTTVTFANAKTDSSYVRSTTSLANINDMNVTTNSVVSHTIASLGGTQSVVLDFVYSQVKVDQSTTKNNTEYVGKVRYYPEAKYFVESEYTINHGDMVGNKGKTIMVGGGYSLTPRLVVMLTTEKFNADDSSSKGSSKTSTLTAGYRF